MLAPAGATARTAVAVTAAAIWLTAGCGSRDDDARRVAESFYAAAAAGDGTGACSRLSEPTAMQLSRQEDGVPCEQAVLELELAETEAVAAEVHERGAAVELANGQTAFLEEESGGWRLTALECRPAGHEMPYDCVVKS